MKRSGEIFISTLMLLSFSATNADETSFTLEEVRANTIEYINTIFATKPPTVADLIRYEGHDQGLIEHESLFEYEVCKKTYKVPQPENSGCNDYLDYRSQHPDRVESLYYQALRKKLAVSLSLLEIESIEYTSGVAGKFAGHFLITIGVKQTSSNPYWHYWPHKQLLLTHVVSPVQAHESGIISVWGIVIPGDDYMNSSMSTSLTSY